MAKLYTKLRIKHRDIPVCETEEYSYRIVVDEDYLIS